MDRERKRESKRKWVREMECERERESVEDIGCVCVRETISIRER